jgi:FKBP-type peptidyl-prolyl cis-trans isomerase
MNMTKIANVLIGLLLLFAAACKTSETKETPNGFKYEVIKAGDGILPKTDQLLVFEYVMRDSKDSVWVDTYDTGFPGVIQIKDTTTLKTEIGMMQMFRQLSSADSVSIKLPAKAFFKDVLGRPLTPEVDSTLTITCNLRVIDIMEMQKFSEFQAKLFEKRKGKQKSKDEDQIDKYLAEKKITAQKDTSGIRYVMHGTSKGAQKPTPNSCVEVKYEGKFLKDGQIFDKNEKIAFSLNQVIPGWKISIPMLGIGDSATFYIPSALAYGPQGYPGAIPPDAILIFDVALLGLGDTYDEATHGCK